MRWGCPDTCLSCHVFGCSLQILNPSETFGDIIVDYSYVECTSACITALCNFREQFPDFRTKEIQTCLRKSTWPQLSWCSPADSIASIHSPHP